MIANDFSPTAVEAMKRNVAYNDLTPEATGPTPGTRTETEEGSNWKGKVRVNEGDAMSVPLSFMSLFLARRYKQDIQSLFILWDHQVL